jgi:hypothetical protein
MSRRQAVRRYQAVSKQAPHSVSRDTFGNRMRAFHQPCLVLTFQPGGYEVSACKGAGMFPGVNRSGGSACLASRSTPAQLPQQ